MVDPRRRGPLRWICGATEFAVEVEPVRPAAVTIQLAGRAVRVRPLAETEARDADVAAVMNRVRDRYRATAAPGQE